MATMKIGTTAQNYASADFTFQVNPTLIHIPLENNYTLRPIPRGRTHTFYGTGGVNPRRIVLTGMVHGASKLANFNSLAGQIHDNNIKRFWISDDRFFNVKGASISEAPQGGRTNFIDYVVALDTITPYALDSTPQTYVATITDAIEAELNQASGDSGAFTNAGVAPASVQWQIENDAGATITKVEIGDASTLATSPHVIEWTPAAGETLDSGDTLVIEIFSYVIDGTRDTNKTFEKAWPTLLADSSNLGNTVVKGTEVPWIDAGGTNQSFSIKLTANNDTATITATWNKSYIG